MNWNHLKMTFVDPHGGMGTGLTGWSPGRGVQYIGGKLSKAYIWAFLKLSETYRY